MAPVFRSALQQYVPDDTLGAFLDYFPEMRDLLRSTNSAENLLHLLLEDTAFSIDNIYALQYDTYGDDLVVAASVAAQTGNNMATLTSTVSNLGGSYLTIIDTIERMVVGEQEMQLSEHHLYGSSRLGIKNYLPRQVYAYWNNTDVIPVADTGSLLSRRPWYSLEYNDVINGLALSPYGSTDQTTSGSQHLAGQRQYEMTNHLGNVLATLSDLPYKSEGEVLQFRVNPALRAVYDYYPFGSLKPGRYLSDTTENCVTMTQSRWVVKYRDSTVWNTGWVSAPATKPNLGIAQQITLSSLPGNGISIEIADTAPVGGLMTAVQPLSVTPNVRQDIELNLQVVSGTFVLRVLEEVNGTDVLLGSLTVSDVGGSDGTVSAPVSYSISILPSTGNVKLQVSSPITMGTVLCCAPRTMNGYWKKITVPYLEQENIVVTLCDSIGDQYRFGFNGMEKDNEFKGIGNSLDFGARMYDSRLGRFLSQDPLFKEFPNYNPYLFAGNKPTYNIDIQGEKEYYYLMAVHKTVCGHSYINITHYKTENSSFWQRVKTFGMIDFDRHYLISLDGTKIDGAWRSFEQMKSDIEGLTEEQIKELAATNLEIDNIMDAQALTIGVESSMYTMEATAYDREVKPEGVTTGGTIGGNKVSSNSKPKYNYGRYGSNYNNHVEKIRSDLNIPKNWVYKPNKNDAGIRFIDPKNNHNHIRISPGVNGADNPASRVPNVKHYKNGSPVDANGKPVMYSNCCFEQ